MYASSSPRIRKSITIALGVPYYISYSQSSEFILAGQENICLSVLEKDSLPLGSLVGILGMTIVIHENSGTPGRNKVFLHNVVFIIHVNVTIAGLNKDQPCSFCCRLPYLKAYSQLLIQK